MKHKMNISCNGIVVSFEIRDVTPTFRIGNIGIKDPETNSTTFVDVYGKKALKYGKEYLTLDEIRNKFVDSEGNSLGKGISTFGTDFYDDNWTDKTGRIHKTTRKHVFIMRDLKDQVVGNTFDVIGIVENVNEDSDGNVKLKVGSIVNAWDKEKKELAPTVRFITLKLADSYEMKQGSSWETPEYIPFDIGDEIHVKGDLLYVPRKRDRYGESVGDMLDGNYVQRIISVSEPDDIDYYEELKRGRIKETKQEKVKNTEQKQDQEEQKQVNISDIDEDDDFLDDIDF